MLWYKAWLETRSRFLISLCGILAMCSYDIFHNDTLCRPYCRPFWYNSVLHVGHTHLAIMWVLAVTLLMMGGLVREKAVGVASFSLALPVSRMRLVCVRICMGLVQAMSLVVIPWVFMFLIAAAVGQTYSAFQTFFHVALLAGGGLLYFALAVLSSSLIEGEYTAPIVSFGIVLVTAIVLDDRSFSAWSPWSFIVGTPYWDRQTGTLAGPIPWGHLTVTVLLAVLLTMVSIKVIQKREF